MMNLSLHPGRRKPFPRMLRQFEHLQGSTYGRLDVFAKDEKAVEISIGPHFVVFTPHHAKLMIKDLGEWIAVTSDDAVVVANARTGESVVVVDTDDDAPGARPPSHGLSNPRRHTGTRKPFPRMLRQFEPLQGSTYGRLDVFAKDEKTVEISIGPHFVVFTEREAKMMIKDLSGWIAVSSDDAMVVENRRTGESVVVVETDEEPGNRPSHGLSNPHPHRRP